MSDVKYEKVANLKKKKYLIQLNNENPLIKDHPSHKNVYTTHQLVFPTPEVPGNEP